MHILCYELSRGSLESYEDTETLRTVLPLHQESRRSTTTSIATMHAGVGWPSAVKSFGPRGKEGGGCRLHMAPGGKKGEREVGGGGWERRLLRVAVCSTTVEADSVCM